MVDIPGYGRDVFYRFVAFVVFRPIFALPWKRREAWSFHFTEPLVVEDQVAGLSISSFSSCLLLSQEFQEPGPLSKAGS